MTLEIIIWCVAVGFLVGVLFSAIAQLISRYFDGK